MHNDHRGRTRGGSTAFGKVDTASDLTQSPVKAGYTGHEYDAELGLVNMKGRIYDPSIQRFLTPDPYVTDPFNPQGLNRFIARWGPSARGLRPTIAPSNIKVLSAIRTRQLQIAQQRSVLPTAVHLRLLHNANCGSSTVVDARASQLQAQNDCNKAIGLELGFETCLSKVSATFCAVSEQPSECENVIVNAP